MHPPVETHAQHDNHVEQDHLQHGNQVPHANHVQHDIQVPHANHVQHDNLQQQVNHVNQLLVAGQHAPRQVAVPATQTAAPPTANAVHSIPPPAHAAPVARPAAQPAAPQHRPVPVLEPAVESRPGSRRGGMIGIVVACVVAGGAGLWLFTSSGESESATAAAPQAAPPAGEASPSDNKVHELVATSKSGAVAAGTASDPAAAPSGPSAPARAEAPAAAAAAAALASKSAAHAAAVAPPAPAKAPMKIAVLAPTAAQAKAAPAKAKAEPAPAPVPTAPPVEEVIDALKERLAHAVPGIHQCAMLSPTRAAQATGGLQLSVLVNPSGQIGEIELSGAQLDKPLETCIRGAVKALKFESFAGAPVTLKRAVTL
jgi:hypothetical protein